MCDKTEASAQQALDSNLRGASTIKHTLDFVARERLVKEIAETENRRGAVYSRIYEYRKELVNLESALRNYDAALLFLKAAL